MTTREKVVEQALLWSGLKESDDSYMEIINTYNSYTGTLPRNTKMRKNWKWCACFWSAIIVKLGLTDIAPIEISCYYLIERAKKMGCWKENDDYIPSPGDAILYDWQDSGKGDNTGTPDHVGVVTYESDGTIMVMEGNYDNMVQPRTIKANSKYIRGFIIPNYESLDTDTGTAGNAGNDIDSIAKEVIKGKWGNGAYRRQKLTQAGYDYRAVQDRVNELLRG